MGRPKGQTCRTCAGDCCRAVHVQFPNWDNLPKDQKQAERKMMRSSVKEILDIGGVFCWDLGRDCKHHNNNKGCALKRKPRLCRSYYCHGKHWRPREEVEALLEA